MKRITQFILCIVLAVSAYGQGVGGNSVPRTVSGISAALDLISSTQGTVFYRGASGWEALPPGTSGQLFSTQGAAANPIWVTATGGAGDVNGPTLGTATDNAIVRFDGTGGKTVQNSAVTIADTTGSISINGTDTATAVNTGGFKSANFGLSTVSGGASYFGGAVNTTNGNLTLTRTGADATLTINGGAASYAVANFNPNASTTNNFAILAETGGVVYFQQNNGAATKMKFDPGVNGGVTFATGTGGITSTGTGTSTFAGAVSVSGTTATWTSGTGSPESVKTAPVGSLYTRTDGGASTTLYVKESGAGNTGWVAK